MFLKKKQIQLNELNFQYINEKEKLKKINFYFLGKKYDNICQLKFFQLLNNIYGLSLKRFISFFIYYFGYTVRYSSILLKVEKIYKLQQILRGLRIDYELIKIVIKNIKYKQQIGLYHGERIKLNLPSRGQRTKTNAGTMKLKRLLLNKK